MVRTNILYNVKCYYSEVIFESQVGATTTLQQVYTLVNGENIDDNVITAWSAYLNSLEKYKSSNSYSRFFLPTFVVVSFFFISICSCFHYKHL